MTDNDNQREAFEAWFASTHIPESVAIYSYGNRVDANIKSNCWLAWQACGKQYEDEKHKNTGQEDQPMPKYLLGQRVVYQNREIVTICNPVNINYADRTWVQRHDGSKCWVDDENLSKLTEGL